MELRDALGDTRLEHLTLTGGNASSGGGIWVDNVSLTLNAVHLEENAGGGLHADWSSGLPRAICRSIRCL